MAAGHAGDVLSTVTSVSLLEGLRDPRHRTVWADFVGRYRPLIIRFGMRAGLSEADAEDAAQATLTVFATAYADGKYDRRKGRLRHWLFGIAAKHVNRAKSGHRRREVQMPGEPGETDFFAGLPDEHRLEDLWNREWQEAVYRQCLAEVRTTFDDRTVAAFELFTSSGQSAREVAERLGMTENAVYLAKHKILKRIREILPAMEEIW